MAEHSIDIRQNEKFWRIAVAVLLALITVATTQEKLPYLSFWAILYPLVLVPVAIIWPIRPFKALGYTLIPLVMTYLFSVFFAPDSELDILFLVCVCLPPVTLLPVSTICFFRLRWILGPDRLENLEDEGD